MSTPNIEVNKIGAIGKWMEMLNTDLSLFDHDIESLSISNRDIGGQIIFNNCRFGTLTLRTLRFLKSVRFENCVFRNEIIVENLEITGQALFVNCTFLGDVHFGGTSFNDIAAFEGSEFHRYASFRDCNFKEYAIFRKVQFKGYLYFKRAKFFRETFFQEASFHAVTSFNAAVFSEDVSFAKCIFIRAPTFQNVKFDGWLGIEDALFLDLRSGECYTAYRTLRVEFLRQKARVHEIELFILEQRALRKREPGWVLRGLGWLYDLLSKYGTSAGRAVTWFVIINLLCLVFYLRCAFKVNGVFHDSLTAATTHLAAQIFAPFQVWRENFVMSGFATNRLLLQFVSSCQSLFSLTLLGFATVALHWRFKRE